MEYGNKIKQEKFIDAHLATEPYYTISYRSGLTVYEESLVNGLYVNNGWNGSGFLSGVTSIQEPRNTRLDYHKFAFSRAFYLDMDGQSLCSHWQWENFEKEIQEKGLHVKVALKHSVRPVRVVIHTLLDGSPILTRWIEIENTGDKPAALGETAIWSGGMQKTGFKGINDWKECLNEGSVLYSVGYMEYATAIKEGHFKWHELPETGYCISGRCKRGRYRHPVFSLRNNATGEYFIGQLAWSGGYEFRFELDTDLQNEACLSFKASTDALLPQRIIDSGEKINTPEMHMGMTFGSFDNSVQAMHDHLRCSVLQQHKSGKYGWVEYAIGGGGSETDNKLLISQIEIAKDIGAEIFFIDAGWYIPKKSNVLKWGDHLGEWDFVNFNASIDEIRNEVHKKGMLFGLWMEPERIGKKADLYNKHPEWIACPYDDNKDERFRGAIDLTDSNAAKWMEDEIVKVLENFKIDFFRLDYNPKEIGEGAYRIRGEYIENFYWRYYEVLYAIFDRVKEKYPGVIFENCASGGGRTDIGMLKRFDHTWVTDWQIAPRSFNIINGMTIPLPPEYIDRLIGGQWTFTTADLNFQSRLIHFGRPTVCCLNSDDHKINPQQIEIIRHNIEIYKSFVRPFMRTGKIFHHTPAYDCIEPKGWGVLELASDDCKKAVAGIFQLSDPKESDYTFKPRGLDISKRYRIIMDNAGQNCKIDGFTLIKQGIDIRLEGALTSELILIEEI